MTIRKQSQTILSSAARTATVTSPVFSAEAVANSVFVIDVTATAATPSITAAIQGKDPESGSFYTILTSAAITSTSTNVIKVGKDFAASANVAANDILPSEFRVVMTHGDADSITYSVSATHMVEI